MTLIKPSDFIAVLKTQLGNPYLLGAAGPKKDDCSGLVCYGYEHWGISVVHKAELQQHLGQAVNLADVRMGDLVFSNWDVPVGSIKFGSTPAAHVGVAINSTEMIVAPHTGSFVQIESFRTPGYLKRLTGVRRYLMDAPGAQITALGTRTLRLTDPHMQGSDVMALQGKIGADVDGIFGPDTSADLKSWQRNNMGTAEADGIFGPNTAKAMHVQWTGK